MTNWTGTSSNAYGNPLNWDDGVPTAGNQGSITLAGADVQVLAGATLDAGIAVAGATLEALGNLTYQGFSAISGVDATSHFTLQIDGGTLTNTANITIFGKNAFGSVVFSGGGTLDNAAAGGAFGSISASGGARMNIGGGGTVLLGSAVQAFDVNSTLFITGPIMPDASGAGVMTIGNSATIELSGFVDPGLTTSFTTFGFSSSPAGGRLLLDTPASFGAKISGFFTAADVVDLGNAASQNTGAPTLAFTEVANIGTVTITTPIVSGTKSLSLKFADPKGKYTAANPTTGGFSVVTDNAGGYLVSTSAACFAAGTRIRTALGEVAVEDLREGDQVVRAGGGTAAIVWLGHRHVDCRRHPRPHDVMPVRVQAGAFGPNAPTRDLLLSPDHAVHVAAEGGRLIPIRYLINGASIAQMEVEHVTYWHVELPAHDVLLAEGLECESYLDTGNRSAFAGQPVTAVHPDFALRVWEAQSCAKLVTHGPLLAQTREMLLARAIGLGHAITADADLHLIADGRVIRAHTDGASDRFLLPPGVAQVRLVSRSQAPADLARDGTDHRVLGVAIAAVVLDGAAMELDGMAFGPGWHQPEAGWRWTDGDATLQTAGAREIVVSVAMSARVLAPAPERDPPRRLTGARLSTDPDRRREAAVCPIVY